MQLALLAQGEADVVVGGGQTRVEAGGLLKLGQGAVNLSLLNQGQPLVEGGLCCRPISRRRLLGVAHRGPQRGGQQGEGDRGDRYPPPHRLQA